MGCPDVDEMLATMPLTIFYEWMEFMSFHPFKEVRADIHAALVSSTIANSTRGKRTKAYKLKDFLLSFDKKERKTVDQMKSVLRAFGKAQNDLVARGGGK